VKNTDSGPETGRLYHMVSNLKLKMLFTLGSYKNVIDTLLFLGKLLERRQNIFTK
jgi:hypothetical protein